MLQIFISIRFFLIEGDLKTLTYEKPRACHEMTMELKYLVIKNCM